MTKRAFSICKSLAETGSCSEFRCMEKVDGSWENCPIGCNGRGSNPIIPRKEQAIKLLEEDMMKGQQE